MRVFGGWSPHRVRLAAIALLAVAFLSGALAGGAAERVRSTQVEVRVRTPKHVPEVFEGLSLTPDQRRRIEAVLERSRPRLDAVLEEMLPRMRAVTDSVDAELRQILTPAQRRELDKRRTAHPAFIVKRRKVGPDSGVKAETVFVR